jgi:CRISPR-associated protein Cas6
MASPLDDPKAEMVDLVFPLRGGAIMADYAARLQEELRRCLPWIGEEGGVGVHPLGGLSHVDGGNFLTGRSRLLLRVPRGRIGDVLGLCSQVIDLGGAAEIGRGSARELWSAAVLYSAFVSQSAADEGTFMAACQVQVGDLGFRGARLICGMARRSGSGGDEIRGFSLMVHGLEPEESLRLQDLGLGGQRQRGCGIFVPHKSVKAVGG